MRELCVTGRKIPLVKPFVLLTKDFSEAHADRLLEEIFAFLNGCVKILELDATDESLQTSTSASSALVAVS